MTKFRLVLVLLCLGLLGAMPFVIGASKPDIAGDQRASTVQGQTDIQRIMAARRATDPIVAAQIERTLKQSGELAEAGKYKEALAALDKLQAIPDKTVPWARDIDQRRDYLTAMTAKAGHLDSQVR